MSGRRVREVGRRRFVGFMAGACVLGSRPVRAQRAGRMVTLGLIIPETEHAFVMRPELDALRGGLRDLGWREGRDITIALRWAGPDPQRQRQAAAGLKALPVALILALGTTSIAAAHAGAPGVPVVMINAGDPVGSRFVTSLAKPGGDLTGTSAAGEEVLAKQVELLAAAVPGLKRVGVLVSRVNPANGFFLDAIRRRAQGLAIAVEPLEIAEETDIEAAVMRARGGALIVVSDPVFLRNRVAIAAHALRARAPSAFGRREYVEAGGLLSYISSSTWHWRTAATFVDKILRGAHPADIPVEQPTMFDLVINAGTAQRLGLTIPQSLLQFASEVIA